MSYRDDLLARAVDQYGYVTTDDARELGVPPVELRKLARRGGGFERVGYGLYCFTRLPAAAHQDVIAAVLAAGKNAVAARETALFLYDLADVLPTRIHLSTPDRVRRELPPVIDLVREALPAEDRVTIAGIPATGVRKSILDCRGRVMTERLIRATTDSAKRGLLQKREASELLRALTTHVDRNPEN